MIFLRRMMILLTVPLDTVASIRCHKSWACFSPFGGGGDDELRTRTRDVRSQRQVSTNNRAMHNGYGNGPQVNSNPNTPNVEAVATNPAEDQLKAKLQKALQEGNFVEVQKIGAELEQLKQASKVDIEKYTRSQLQTGGTYPSIRTGLQKKVGRKLTQDEKDVITKTIENYDAEKEEFKEGMVVKFDFTGDGYYDTESIHVQQVFNGQTGVIKGKKDKRYRVEILPENNSAKGTQLAFNKIIVLVPGYDLSRLSSDVKVKEEQISNGVSNGQEDSGDVTRFKPSSGPLSDSAPSISIFEEKKQVEPTMNNTHTELKLRDDGVFQVISANPDVVEANNNKPKHTVMNKNTDGVFSVETGAAATLNNREENVLVKRYSNGSTTEGSLIGKHYMLKTILGEGTFGVVYKAINDSTGQDVAIKMLKHKETLDKTYKEEAQKEFELLKPLNHKHIVRCFESFDHEGSFCAVFEFANKGDLKKHIDEQKKQNRRFDKYHVSSMFTQIVHGMSFLHGWHIMHRDLKPANIVLCEFQPDHLECKIADFGLARAMDGSQESASTICGTKVYMSPEILDHSRYSFQNDIWGLGCILFELCELRRPFELSSEILRVRVEKNNNNIPATNFAILLWN